MDSNDSENAVCLLDLDIKIGGTYSKIPRCRSKSESFRILDATVTMPGPQTPPSAISVSLGGIFYQQAPTLAALEELSKDPTD
jgi:hypothetical protein